MKVYIGNKTICLATPEDKDTVEGYEVIYSDGSETWLTKEIFEFEYRKVEEEEFDLMISTIAQELSSEDIAELMEFGADENITFDMVDELPDVEYEVTDNDAVAMAESAYAEFKAEENAE